MVAIGLGDRKHVDGLCCYNLKTYGAQEINEK